MLLREVIDDLRGNPCNVADVNRRQVIHFTKVTTTKKVKFLGFDFIQEQLREMHLHEFKMPIGLVNCGIGLFLY